MQALDVANRLTPETMDRIEDILDNRPTPPKNWRNH
jgi:hypothetical protein